MRERGRAYYWRHRVEILDKERDRRFLKGEPLEPPPNFICMGCADIFPLSYHRPLVLLKGKKTNNLCAECYAKTLVR